MNKELDETIVSLDDQAQFNKSMEIAPDYGEAPAQMIQLLKDACSPNTNISFPAQKKIAEMIETPISYRKV